MYLAPFTRLLAGIDYLAITVFRIVRDHSLASPRRPLFTFSLSGNGSGSSLSFSPTSVPPPLSFSLILSRFGPELRALRPTRSLQEFFAQQRAYRYGIMQR